MTVRVRNKKTWRSYVLHASEDVELGDIRENTLRLLAHDIATQDRITPEEIDIERGENHHARKRIPTARHHRHERGGT